MSPPKREMHDNPVGTVARERRRKNGEGGGKQKGTGDITQAAAAPPPRRAGVLVRPIAWILWKRRGAIHTKQMAASKIKWGGGVESDLPGVWTK